MRMFVDFRNCTRPAIERIKIETEYRDVLLELCNGIETAAHIRDVHYAIARQTPHTDWNRFCRTAFAVATKKLTDKEREAGFFLVKILPERNPNYGVHRT